MNPQEQHSAPREAPVADWVTIQELYDDPFPAFERLRAEGGVHWVPAVGRYLITSYDAVHDTEMDQEIFSANEKGSLMIRAMGHSMLRKDGEDHRPERAAWQPVLRPSVVKKAWTPIFERNAEKYLAELKAKGPGADLIWDFAAPYVAENLRAVTGLHNVTQQDLQRWSQTMIDATGNYADDPEVWAKGEASFNEVDDALDEMLDWHRQHPDSSLISALLALPDYQMPIESIRANLKMTIGGGLNEPRDAIGVASWALLRDPYQRSLVEADPTLWGSVFDEAIRWVAPIGMYSRQVTQDTVLQGVRLPQGARLGICILAANRDENHFKYPNRFDITRTNESPHLAFGKGVHVCLGAWVARAEVADIALPKLFAELPQLSLIADRPAIPGGWVFRGMDLMPVTWKDSSAVNEPQEQDSTSTSPGTSGSAINVAIVGSGPSGCYTAQALVKELPDAKITVFDSSPVPYGLVRSGVAADHQGTKAVEQQFARLFENNDVEFVGSTRVHTGEPSDDVPVYGRPSFFAPHVPTMKSAGAELTLDQLRDHFDVVVLATGLRGDKALPIPGASANGVYGAGLITRLLNGEATEHNDNPQTPPLGEAVTIVGMGNVAMDLARLLGSIPAQLEESDVDETTHRGLTQNLKTLHIVGRSQPSTAKFDPSMLREVLNLPHSAHFIHGLTESEITTENAELIHREKQIPQPEEARLNIHWWFGATPREVLTDTANDVAGLRIETAEDTHDISSTSLVTAIGFEPIPGSTLVELTEEARETGQIESGLYATGWLRRGPRGTIATQRTDAIELARLIAKNVPAQSDTEGTAALRPYLARATSYDGWLLIDAHEKLHNTPPRPRTKITCPRSLRILAAQAAELPEGLKKTNQTPTRTVNPDLPWINIAFATESGNAELVAEELANALSPRVNATIMDLSTSQPEDLNTTTPTIVICSTYDEGELPTAIRPLHAQLLEESTDLSNLNFAVFGMGDTSYTHFAAGPKTLASTLTSLGARQIDQITRHDAGGRILAPEMATVWAEEILQELLESSGLASRQATLA